MVKIPLVEIAENCDKIEGSFLDGFSSLQEKWAPTGGTKLAPRHELAPNPRLKNCPLIAKFVTISLPNGDFSPKQVVCQCRLS
jgi:hypothetical protein